MDVTSLLWRIMSEDFTTHVYICPILLSQSVAWVFLIFLLAAEGPLQISLPLQHDRSKRTEEWKLHKHTHTHTQTRTHTHTYSWHPDPLRLHQSPHGCWPHTCRVPHPFSSLLLWRSVHPCWTLLPDPGHPVRVADSAVEQQSLFLTVKVCKNGKEELWGR